MVCSIQSLNTQCTEGGYLFCFFSFLSKLLESSASSGAGAFRPITKTSITSAKRVTGSCSKLFSLMACVCALPTGNNNRLCSSFWRTAKCWILGFPVLFPGCM